MVNFIGTNEEIVFSTYPGEQVIFQMGTNDPDRAVKVMKLIWDDVAGIDVNMGCPKKFSVHQGMGAALLSTPDLAVDILTSLVNEVKKAEKNITISCKIRLLPDLEETKSFIKKCSSTGIDFMTIHGRIRKDRPTERCRLEDIAEIFENQPVPLFFNGDIFSSKDIEKALKITGAHGIMVARGAQWDYKIFDTESKEDRFTSDGVGDAVLSLVSISRDIADLLSTATKNDRFKRNGLPWVKFVTSKILKRCVDKRLRYLQDHIHRSKSYDEMIEAIHELLDRNALRPKIKRSPFNDGRGSTFDLFFKAQKNFGT